MIDFVAPELGVAVEQRSESEQIQSRDTYTVKASQRLLKI